MRLAILYQQVLNTTRQILVLIEFVIIRPSRNACACGVSRTLDALGVVAVAAAADVPAVHVDAAVGGSGARLLLGLALVHVCGKGIRFC